MPANPDWTRDELIVALDAYLRWQGNPPPKTSPAIAELSRTIKQVQGALGVRGEETLRNVNGVYMKLMNFRRFDPAYISRGRSGLPKGNKLDRVVWDELSSRPDRISLIAAAIRKSMDGAPSPLALNEAEEEEAVEGRWLSVVHRQRERSRKLVAKKKAAAMKLHGALVCEACNFSYTAQYGERGRGFIECHHTRPLESLGDGTPTRLFDLALLCANCHRMIHAHRPWLTVFELKALVSFTSQTKKES